jgi:hypothetical protein
MQTRCRVLALAIQEVAVGIYLVACGAAAGTVGKVS